MAATRDQSKIVTPFMPSLFHCSAVRIAIPMLEEFGVETLEMAFDEIKQGDLTTFEGSRKRRKAKEDLLYIPPHLREDVMRAVHGSHEAVLEWTRNHPKFRGETFSFHWRSDGSIDTLQTAQSLVQDASFDIAPRLELAYAYCLRESVRNLLDEVGQSARAWRYRPSQNGSNRMEIEQYFDVSLIINFAPKCRFFVSTVSPEDKPFYFRLLEDETLDDLRFCLYSLTKEDEEQMLLQNGPRQLLLLHLTWPLQTLFVQTAAKLWNYIDDKCFEFLLHYIFIFIEERRDFNYSELLEGFWHASPLHLRESAKKVPILNNMIDCFFDKIE